MSGKKDSLIKRKLDWCLLLVDLRKPLKEVAKVLHFAAYDKPEPYGPRNWMGGNNKEFRYELRTAIERHTDAIENGESHDGESKVWHRAHIICSHLFLLYFEIVDLLALKGSPANPCPHDSITGQVCDDCQGYINPVKTRYPWRDAPDWAMWGATDLSGDFCWYEDEPQHGCTEWLKLSGEHKLIKSNAPACLDWKETLEARPK